VSSLLLVEPHLRTREDLARRLRLLGHLVREAADAQGAWVRLQAAAPEVLLLSLQLPMGEALGLGSRLRQQRPGVRVLAYDHAHRGQRQGAHLAARLHCDAYVEDISQGELATALQALLSRPARELPTGLAAVLARPPESEEPLGPGVASERLLQWLAAGRTGVAGVDEGAARHQLFLQAGRVVGAESAAGEGELSRWLLAHGRLGEVELREARREMASAGLTLPLALVATGVVTAGAPLQALLREHARSVLLLAARAQAGTLRFHAGDGFLPHVQAQEVPAAPTLLQGARDGTPFRVFVQRLQPFQAQRPVRTETAPPLGLGAHDQKWLDGIDGRETTQRLLTRHRASGFLFASLLWFLVQAGAVRFEAGPARPDVAPALPPLETAEALQEALAQAEEATHYGALGLGIAASDEEVAQALAAQEARLRPAATPEARALARLLDARWAASARVLGQAEPRLRYLEKLLGQMDLARGGRPLVPAAEVAMQRAGHALARRREREALVWAQRAEALAPHEPDFTAAVALLVLLDPLLPLPLRIAACREHAARALALQPGHARSLAALALAELRAGAPQAALSLVKEALRAQPDHPIAQWVWQQVRSAGQPAGG
jgi:DNA-binding NarL/FixJ family response regulator/tetratricopeptide (TPR) repeat protein